MTNDAFARPVAAARPRRLVRRAEKPQLSFMPFGLAPLAGMAIVFVLALGPAAFGWVQDPTERAARQALSDIGADWAVARISGQWVVLEGAPPSREAATLAIDAVRKARATTIFGPAAPASRVTEQFAWPDDASEPATVVSAPPLENPASTPEPAPVQPAAADASACTTFMPTFLAAAVIEFDEASETVRAANAPLLDGIVRMAAICPGALRIEGHTDNTGADDLNMDLSRKRANAVRSALIQRGMDPRFVFAEGRGASRPAADNSTEAGRARNRRIEIRVAPPPT